MFNMTKKPDLSGGVSITPSFGRIVQSWLLGAGYMLVSLLLARIWIREEPFIEELKLNPGWTDFLNKTSSPLMVLAGSAMLVLLVTKDRMLDSKKSAKYNEAAFFLLLILIWVFLALTIFGRID